MPGRKIHRMQMASLRERPDGEAWILEQYVGEGLTVRQLVKALDVSTCAFYEWLKEEPGRWERWKEAKRVRAETLAEETQEIADQVREDPDAVAKAGLRIKARQWLAKVLDPETFGERKEAVVQIGELHLTALREINAADTQRRIEAAKLKDAEVDVADYEVVHDDIESLL